MSIRTLFAVIIASLGGFLSGYHTAVISGALIFIAPEFHLMTCDECFVASIVLIGAIVGTIPAGPLADRFGRKKMLLSAAVCSAIGTVFLFHSGSYAILLWGRLISGLAVGIISVVTPLYIAEISSPQYRGGFVSLYQLAITFGILIAYLINYLFAAGAEWRMMFVFGIVPALIQFVCGLFIPETPPWLLAHQQQSCGHPQPSTKGGSWKDVANRKVYFVLFIGLALAAFQQITGINAVIYFAPKIFQMAHFSSVTGAIFATLGMGVINFIATIFAVFLLDRWGRRPLLLVGLWGMAVSLLCIATAFATHIEWIDTIAIFGLMAYIISFAISLGPITWVILSEIYPLNIRGKVMTIALFLNSLCNYFVVLTFLHLVNLIEASGTFYLYAAISLLGLLFVYRFVPETKGKNLP